MRPLIAIDPGTTESAYVVLSEGMATGGYLIDAMGLASNEELADIVTGGSQTFEVACEVMRNMGQFVGESTFETAYWIGEYRRICKEVGHSWHPVYRNDVKLFLCNSTRAKDADISTALASLYGGTGKTPAEIKRSAKGVKANHGPLYGIKSHIWSALGVGVTYLGGGSSA